MPEIIIEIAGPRNESHVFKPLAQRLRGRWDNANVAQKDKSEALKAISTTHFIPGIHLSIDPERKVATMFDPLATPEEGGTPEGHAIWNKIAPVMSSFPEFFSPSKPWKKVVREKLTQDEIKTWLYEMKRTVDAGYARIVQGDLPDIETIRAMPGKRRIKAMSSVYVPEDKRYVDRVEPNGRRETAGAGSGSGGSGNGK